MDDMVIDIGGNAYTVENDRRRHVRFPVSLAVKYSDEIPLVFDSFTINISKSGVFIYSDEPLSEGEKLIIHFYIPPENKLLASLNGKVVQSNINRPGHPNGMHIQYADIHIGEISKLEEYLDERRHLIDKSI